MRLKLQWMGSLLLPAMNVPSLFVDYAMNMKEERVIKLLLSAKPYTRDMDIYYSDAKNEHGAEPSYHVALGSDNSWYLFAEKWIKTGFPNVALALGDALPREIMTLLLDKESVQWKNVAESELGGLWSMEGSLETWSWSLNVPVLSSFSEDDDVNSTTK